MNYAIIRFLGYVLGFVLFYAPCALFSRGLVYLMYGEWLPLTIHSVCFRIPIEHILDGRIFNYHGAYVIFTWLLLASALVLGPVFCGRLCPAGAFSEYLSLLVPDKYKIDWSKHVEIAPLRYGMLLGYMLLPFFGSMAACAFCNYYLFDLIANYLVRGYIISFTSSMLLTLFLWLVVFGLFTKGGRGFCNFLCPVGALLNLLHRVGRKTPWGLGMQVDKAACVGCTKCQQSCPMRSIKVEQGKAEISVDNCICCGVCAHNCPKKAIGYGRR